MKMKTNRAALIALWRKQYPGIYVKWRELADGSERRHVYAWRGKGAPEIADEPGTQEFTAAYLAASAKQRKGDETVQTLFDDYFDSGEFTHTLRSRTQKDYRKLGVVACAKWGASPKRLLDAPEAPKLFAKWRDKLAKASLRQADYMMAFCSAVFSLAIKRRDIRTNPAAGLGRLYDGTRVKKIWEDEHIKPTLAVIEAEYPQMRLPFLIALWTGAAMVDIRALVWANYDGQFLRYSASKGNSHGKAPKDLEVPVARPLREALDAARRKSGPICPTRDGAPYTDGGFHSVWQDVAIKAGVHGQRTFHDLRGTAVTRLYKSGVQKKHIGIFTGHTDAEVNKILTKHYLDRDLRAEGLEAIEAMDAHFGAGASAAANVVALPARAARRPADRADGEVPAQVVKLPAKKPRAGRPRKRVLVPRIPREASR